MSPSVFNFRSLWLFYVYFFFIHTIQKSFFHIHLVLVPLHHGCKCHGSSNGSIPCYWKKCLLIISYLFLIETSSHKSFLTSICNIFYLENPFGRYHIISFWFEYHNIFYEFVNVRSSTYPSLLHSTLKVGTQFTLGKVSIHQEVVHHVIPCQTQISSVVTPPEVEYHLPSSFCTYGSMLDIYWSIEYVMS